MKPVAGGGGRAEASMGTRSGNMGQECTPITVVHKGRYVAYRDTFLNWHVFRRRRAAAQFTNLLVI